MSSILFGGQPCLDPLALLETCRRLELDTSWWGMPNSWACPLGVRSGTGHLLLSRASLNLLGLDTPRDLTFSIDRKELAGAVTTSQSVTHKSLHVVRAECLTPGLRADPKAAFLVELADRRRLLRAAPIDRGYNVRSSPGGSYLPLTTDLGSAWTWATMIQDVWQHAATAENTLGTFPGLPFTPDGTPDGFAFWGWYALDALEVVLSRVACALKLDTQTNTFSVVRLGASDTSASSALVARDRQRVWDGEDLSPYRGRVPQYCQVLFPIERAVSDTTGASPYYPLLETDPSGTLTGVEQGSVVNLHDDLPAIYTSSGSLTNATALATRAAERAGDFFRQVRVSPLSRIFSLPLSDAGLRPGSQVKATRWADRGRGLVTEVGWFPGLMEGNPFLPDGAGAGMPRNSELSPWEYSSRPGTWVRGGDWQTAHSVRDANLTNDGTSIVLSLTFTDGTTVSRKVPCGCTTGSGSGSGCAYTLSGLEAYPYLCAVVSGHTLCPDLNGTYLLTWNGSTVTPVWSLSGQPCSSHGLGGRTLSAWLEPGSSLTPGQSCPLVLFDDTATYSTSAGGTLGFIVGPFSGSPPTATLTTSTTPSNCCQGIGTVTPETITVTLTFLTDSTACGGSGSGSGSGSGGCGAGTVTGAGCCPGKCVPTTLHLTLTSSCACASGTVVLAWNGVLWQGTLSCAAHTTTWQLVCSGTSWKLKYLCDGFTYQTSTASSVNCVSFDVSGTFASLADPSGCCAGEACAWEVTP